MRCTAGQGVAAGGRGCREECTEKSGVSPLREPAAWLDQNGEEDSIHAGHPVLRGWLWRFSAGWNFDAAVLSEGRDTDVIVACHVFDGPGDEAGPSSSRPGKGQRCESREGKQLHHAK